jgi:hypothetical protein
MAISKDTHNPNITPGNQADGASYPKTVQQVQTYYNNVVNQQYQQAGLKRQQKG